MTLSDLDTLDALLAKPLSSLMEQADRLRSQFQGSDLQLCSILNAKSGRCSEDCRFCAQSAHHDTDVEVYGLRGVEQIVAAAERAQAMGSSRFGIVTSGNRLTATEVDRLVQAVAEIRRRTGLGVCGSLGALDPESLERLAEAGLSRYHHNLETSRRFYRQIVTTHDYDQRVATVQAAKAVGLEVCSGGIIGLGESWQDRWDLAGTLAELRVDSVPINILTPIPGTPLAGQPPLPVDEVLRTLCLFRLRLPWATLKIAAGREAVLRDRQLQGFLAGANGMIIGGYLTVPGDDVDRDRALIEQIRRAWTDW